MTERQYTVAVSFSPWSGTEANLPRAQLLHYDDGETIPMIAFDEHRNYCINLGTLPDAEVVMYLRHLADQCQRLAGELVRRQRQQEART